MNRQFVLGIDTGGTHTDAVVYDPESKSVLASAKAATTHHDLRLGISQALKALSESTWPGGLAAIERISLSTTLATNAVAEGYGRPVGLLMIGYDADHQSVGGLISRLPMVETAYFAGGHDYYGRQEAELDEAAVRSVVAEMESRVQGWAVSGLFSVKNQDHELRVASIIKEFSDKPITLGRDLTGQYDAVRRAATAALNAGLVPVINELLNAVKKSAAEIGLKARLMVVKGDGTLVSEEWARAKPIETVVSGPAASLGGAGVLGRGLLRAKDENVWVIDIGGTTTDLAYLKKRRPLINENGAKVGHWHTMTTAVQTRTRGLGGDSRVELDPSSGRITIGPRRVVPICRLAQIWPEGELALKSQRMVGAPSTTGAIFLLRGSGAPEGLNAAESLMVQALAEESPQPLVNYARNLRKNKQHFVGLSVINHPAVMLSAFTPTDAMSILGLYNEGSRSAAVNAAEIMGQPLKLSAEELAGLVLDEFGRLLAQEIVSYSLDQARIKFEPEVFEADGLFSEALKRRDLEGLEMVFKSKAQVFLLGGPAAALTPFLARYIDGRITVPPIFDAASAVGAASAPISLSRKVDIHLLPGKEGYRLFLPDKVVDGWSVELLADKARAHMDGYMRNLASLAGAGNPKIEMSLEDRKVVLKTGRVVHLGAGLTFTAEQI